MIRQDTWGMPCARLIFRAPLNFGAMKPILPRTRGAPALVCWICRRGIGGEATNPFRSPVLLSFSSKSMIIHDNPWSSQVDQNEPFFWTQGRPSHNNSDGGPQASGVALQGSPHLAKIRKRQPPQPTVRLRLCEALWPCLPSRRFDSWHLQLWSLVVFL